MSPCLSLPLGLSKNLRGWFLNLLRLSPNFLCFHHEWGLSSSYATDNGGKNGGNVGGKNGGDVPSLSPVCPQLCHKSCHKSCHKTKKRMQVLMQKMQPPVQRLQPWMKRLQVWRTMDEIVQFANRDKNYIRLPNDSQKDFNSYVKLLIKGCKSEEKGIKVIVLCRKNDFPSLFRGKLANFVRVFI